LRDQVRTAYRTDPVAVKFGVHSFERQPIPPREFSIESVFQIDNLRLERGDPSFDVRVTPVPDRPNVVRVSVSPAANLPPGDFHFDLVMRPESKQYTACPDVTMTVSGRVVEDVQPLPERVEFGSCTIGRTTEQHLTLYSMTDRPFSVEGWEVKGGGVNVVRCSENVVFKLRQVAQTLGESSGEVLFHITSAGGRHFTLVVPVCYFGVVATGT